MGDTRYTTTFLSVGPFSSAVTNTSIPKGPRRATKISFSPFDEIVNLPADVWTHQTKSNPLPADPGNTPILTKYTPPPGGTSRPRHELPLCIPIPDNDDVLSTQVVNNTAACYFNILTMQWEYGVR